MSETISDCKKQRSYMLKHEAEFISITNPNRISEEEFESRINKLNEQIREMRLK